MRSLPWLSYAFPAVAFNAICAATFCHGFAPQLSSQRARLIPTARADAVALFSRRLQFECCGRPAFDPYFIEVFAQQGAMPSLRIVTFQ